MSKPRNDDEVLADVVAEYRRLCAAGFGKVARSRAIETKVPAGRRHHSNGDHDLWWQRLTDTVGSYRPKHERTLPRTSRGQPQHIAEIIPHALPQGVRA
ncbi:MAG TPA: hypothetical protein VJJ47_01430 [Candidatus Paceibacterota bacterium]